MKAVWRMLVVGVCGIVVLAPAWAAEPQTSAPPQEASSTGKVAATTAAAESRQVTQAELAQMLVKLLGLTQYLPPSPTDFECFAVLMENSISPADGWKPDAKVVLGDLARVIVLAMKRQHEIKNPDDPLAWIDFLKANGISLESVGEATAALKPLAEPIAPNVVRANTRLLEKRHKTNPIDEVNYGVDIGFLVRTLSQLEFEEGEFRPKPVTPD